MKTHNYSRLQTIDWLLIYDRIKRESLPRRVRPERSEERAREVKWGPVVSPLIYLRFSLLLRMKKEKGYLGGMWFYGNVKPSISYLIEGWLGPLGLPLLRLTPNGSLNKPMSPFQGDTECHPLGTPNDTTASDHKHLSAGIPDWDRKVRLYHFYWDIFGKDPRLMGKSKQGVFIEVGALSDHCHRVR